MNSPIEIQILPRGETIQVEAGTALQDLLFKYGVEFPCGGLGRCRKCRVRVLRGQLTPTPGDYELLTPEQLAEGWRLACQARVWENLTFEIEQWEAAILTDHGVFEFKPKNGLGVAIDLGTTTLVVELLDLQTGNVLAVQTSLNPQARFGADIMSRVQYALRREDRCQLQDMIRRELWHMIQTALQSARKPASELVDVAIVGNSVMHHSFCDLDPEPFARYPFESPALGLQVFGGEPLGWGLSSNATVRFLPCLGGFVGSDILAGIMATHLHESSSLQCLIDLGTNGEIALGNQDRILCASTAAGPAFEGARISMGMRAAAGAISEVRLVNGSLQCSVLGQGSAQGLCGSGLVDAVAAGLNIAHILPSGRFARRNEPLCLRDSVQVSQADVRELQLAKGAIAAGIRLLLETWNAKIEDVERVYLAGAFGNYINRDSARRIGLFQFDPDRVQAAGNTALLGAKLALFSYPEEDGSYQGLLDKVRHLSLSQSPHFQDVFAEEMFFPEHSQNT